jgi:hypothetical protein
MGLLGIGRQRMVRHSLGAARLVLGPCGIILPVRSGWESFVTEHNGWVSSAWVANG